MLTQKLHHKYLSEIFNNKTKILKLKYYFINSVRKKCVVEIIENKMIYIYLFISVTDKSTLLLEIVYFTINTII